MKTLFLAIIGLTRYEYMADSREETVTRIVWANDDADAREIIEREYNGDVPYSSACFVNSISITEALGTPEA